MAGQVKLILDENKAERHIRGGEATKMKYCREGRKVG
jgi:putative DeoR family transcriptional regulator (stage III sporulation protein D)